MSKGLSFFNSAYVINIVISFVVFYAVILLSKNAFCSLNREKYVIIDKFIDIVFVVYMFTLTMYNYSLCTDAILSASSKTFTKDIVGCLPLVSAILCSLLGIESLSRSSYISFFIVVFIGFLITLLTFDGLNTENIYPILGSNVSKIVKDYTSFSSLFALLGIYMLRFQFKEKSAAYTVLKKSLRISFLLWIILTIVCILIIPYPMGNLYGFSLEGIFSMAKSGSFFHRFELLLIITVLVFDIISVSLGLYLLSFTFSKLCKSKDYKPFILIFSVVLFYLNLIIKNTDVIFCIYNISSIFLIALLVVKSQILFRSIERNRP